MPAALEDACCPFEQRLECGRRVGARDIGAERGGRVECDVRPGGWRRRDWRRRRRLGRRQRRAARRLPVRPPTRGCSTRAAWLRRVGRAAAGRSPRAPPFRQAPTRIWWNERGSRRIGGAGLSGAPLEHGRAHRLCAGPPFVLNQIGGHQVVAGLEVLLGPLHGAGDTGRDVAEGVAAAAECGQTRAAPWLSDWMRESSRLDADEPLGLGFAGGIEGLLRGVEARDRLHQGIEARGRGMLAGGQRSSVGDRRSRPTRPRRQRRRRAARRDRSEGCAGASGESHSVHRIAGNRGADVQPIRRAGR